MSWPKRVAVVVAALALLYAAFAVAVLRSYDDVLLRPYAGPPGLVAGGVSLPPRYVWREGELATVAFHLANDGIVPIRVTAFQPAVHWNVETAGVGLYDGRARALDLPPFRAFTLGPGEYRDVVATFRMVHCVPAETGTTAAARALRVRYTALGWAHDRLVPLAGGGLRVDFDRALGEPASKPAWCARYAAQPGG